MTVFFSARLKLLRAKSFVAELRSVMEHHLKTNPPTIETTEYAEPDGNSLGGVGGKFTIPETPPEVGVIIGDVVHSLRTALDHTASELARMNNKSDRHVYFPFAENEGQLDTQISKKNFTYCGPEAVEILKSFRPYHGGNPALRALHDLDIMDKHRTLVPSNRYDVGQFEVVKFVKSPIDGKSQLRAVPPKIGDLELVFPPDTGELSGKPVLETLESLIELCEDIVKAFASMKSIEGDRPKPKTN